MICFYIPTKDGIPTGVYLAESSKEHLDEIDEIIEELNKEVYQINPMYIYNELCCRGFKHKDEYFMQKRH